jgi:hypothetical protein
MTSRKELAIRWRISVVIALVTVVVYGFWLNWATNHLVSGEPPCGLFLSTAALLLLPSILRCCWKIGARIQCGTETIEEADRWDIGWAWWQVGFTFACGIFLVCLYLKF